MNQQPSLSEDHPALLQDGAFVIQLRDDTSFSEGRLCGRIEHIRSGMSAPFHSLAALVAFMDEHAGGKQALGENA